jgi:hypothetical protein
VAFFSTAAAASFFSDEGAAGVVSSLNGCAADVEVAVGGACEEPGAPCRGLLCVAVLAEMGVALRRVEAVVKGREARDERSSGIEARGAARRQRRQIILKVWTGSMGGMEWRVATYTKSSREAGKRFSGSVRSICLGIYASLPYQSTSTILILEHLRGTMCYSMPHTLTST